MTKFYKRSLLPVIFFLLGSANLLAQTTISGTIKDAGGTPVPGVNIVVKGSVTGTISDQNGQYNLSTTKLPPFTLSFSFIGMRTQEIEVKDSNSTALDISMEEENLLGQEVVVSASRMEESILKAPVTIEKMDLLAIKAAPTPDFYDGLANMKGVQATSGSLNFTAVNTRGFATIANERFVQWVDGMDTQAPLLNFPTGNIIGLGELDAESMELVPGAASALYGPNAFNGILLMNSKSPFDYQGLSAQVKYGVTHSHAAGSNPLGQYGIRYAKAFNNKFAFKVNASMLMAKDWLSNDYKTDRTNPESPVDLSGKRNFDGLNLYGDETVLPVGSLYPGVGNLTRTGFREEDLVDDRQAKSIKYDAALHYRVNEKIEAILTYRHGGGSSIYQGTEKYALRDFTQDFIKLEARGTNFFVRAYQTTTDAGKSYNLSALGGYMNETYAPSATKWVPDFVLAMQGYVPGVAPGDPTAARGYADRNRPLPGSPEFNNLINVVKANYFQVAPTGTYNGIDGNSYTAQGGASFKDASHLNHVEFNYKFYEQIKWAEIQIGGNWRQYDLFSNGTVFNEGTTTKDASGNYVLDANGNPAVSFNRIKISEFGGYAVIAKTFAEKLKMTASMRYDKNENFQGQATPRFSMVYELDQKNNLRASVQTGFRNPSTQSQFIYFPSSSGTLLGSTERNAAQYGIHNGGAYTLGSYQLFTASGGKLDATTGDPIGGNSLLLVTANIPYVQPEKLVSFEVGYKGVIGKDLLLDWNAYYTDYSNFIGSQIVASKLPTTFQGRVIPAGTSGATVPGSLWAPYVNSTRGVSSFGMGLGATYNLPSNFSFTGNYNYAQYDAVEDKDFRAGFNTPTNRFSVGLSNRKIIDNLGFNINFRYQDGFRWESSYGTWNVPSFGVVDAQLNYKVSSIKSIFKLGATNLGGGDYRTNLGAPFVGQQYYISITFDEFLK